MIIPTVLIIILFSAFLSLVLGTTYKTLQLVNTFWLVAFIYSILLLFQGIFPKLTRKAWILIQDIVNVFKRLKVKERYVLILIVALSFASGLSKTYYLGGDDTRLFYEYPSDYLQNLASSVSPGNAVSTMIGFLPNRSVYYLAYFLASLKTLLPFLNLQTALYTANILFGLYFFYKLLDYIIQVKVKFSVWIYFISSFFYVFSIYNIYILFNARLIAIYLITLFPLSLFLFLKSIKENKLYLILLISILWSVFGIVSAASLWFVASAVVVIPLTSYLLWDCKFKAIKNFIVLGITLFFLNLHWLYLLPHTTLFDQSGISKNNASSREFLEESARGLISNAEINELFYPLNNLFHYQIQDNFKWPYLPVFERYYLKLIPFTSIFILVIIMAGTSRQRGRLGGLYNVSLVSLLFVLYLFTINLGKTSLGNWGINLFVVLTERVPGFVAFRNMYDKFGYALSFVYAFSLGVSLTLLARRFSETIFKRILIGVTIVSTLISLPYLAGRFKNLPVWKTTSTFHTTTQLNDDYLNMMDFIKLSNNEGRYLTLPVSRGNIAFIQDGKLPNHFYVGVSPQLILSGTNDYSGGLSFGVFETEFIENLLEGNYNKIGEILQRTNTKYVIVNNTITSDLKNSYLLGDGLYTLQGEDFLRTILGQKVRDFGSRYSIYKINPKYDNAKIYIADQDVGQKPSVKFDRISETEYSVNVVGFNQGTKLVFLEPFDNSWSLYLADGRTKINIVNNKHDNWANSWIVPLSVSDALTKGNEIDLKIIFTPAKSLAIYNNISYISLALSVGFVIYNVYAYKKEIN